MYIHLDYTYVWDPDKDEVLRKTRGVGFAELLASPLAAVWDNAKRPGQHLFLIVFDEYIWVVPHVRSGRRIFLKTLYPSRKYTRLWRKGELE